MGIENSKLNKNKISKILKENYGIDVLEVKNINKGTANIFKIYAPNNEYILKEFTEGRSKESVIKETNIINFLNNKNIKVPIYIKTKTNKYYIEYENRIIILQKFINGYTIENNTGDYNKTIESAKILGKLTKALEDYKGLEEEGIIEKSFSKESLQQGRKNMLELQSKLNNNPYKDTIYKDLQDKITISKYLEKNFDFDSINKMTIMNAHGDYSVQQLIYRNNEEPTVIDFETAKKLPIIWEVMRSYSYIDKDAQNGKLNIDTLVKYIEEFSKYVTLNEYDLKYAGQMYLIQIVSSVFGYKQYNANYEKKDLLEFAFFRTNLCRFLYEHLDEISSKISRKVLKF